MRASCACSLWLLSVLLVFGCSDGTVTTAKDTGGSGGSAGANPGAGGSSMAGAAGANAGGSGGTASGGTTSIPSGLGLGADCSEASCRAGLACVNDACVLSGESQSGDACLASGECEADLVCFEQECTAAGPGAAGDGCQNDKDCRSGLRCGLVGFGAQCQPEGALDIGADCTSSSECLGGLACLSGQCLSPPAGVPSFGLPTYSGVECDSPSESGARAYFEVPGAEDAQEGDFFRLPFPNDVRLTDGSPDLSGFPTPGVGLLGVDPVQIYLDQIEAHHTGWGTEPMVLFRFSGRIDHETLTSQEAADEGRVRFVDVTPNIPDEDREGNLGWQMFYTTARSNYVCHNWLSVSRPLGTPLRPGHTYAVILSTGARDIQGNPIERSENLIALLADSAPSDSALRDAYDANAPLRDYLATNNGNDSGRLDLDASDVLNASVITVHDHHAPMAELASDVAGEPVPAVSDWVLCDNGATSPCPDATGSRACGNGTSDYDEYHALVTLPIFQEGTPPYLTEDGGISANGKVRDEPVCMSLTVPKAPMPTGGWPLVVYAHGTGGSFRAHVRDEVAGVLARASDPFAVLGIDQVQHGPRRGSSTESPQNLFFNFLNPEAALGNPLQGAADQLSLLKLAANFDFTAQQTGGAAISVDSSKVVFFGHSQGSMHGSIMLPFADIPGAVLSGNAAGLRYSLLAKTQPVNIAAALPLVLVDPSGGSLNMGERHPALGMLQQWIDAADPYNFAELAGVRPGMDQSPHHIFQTFGLDDSYSPPTALFAYGLAARADMAPLGGDFTPEGVNENSRLRPKAEAVSGNRLVDGSAITVVTRQYEPADDSDGHFVVFDVEQANDDMLKFLEELAAGTTPTVGE